MSSHHLCPWALWFHSMVARPPRAGLCIDSSAHPQHSSPLPARHGVGTDASWCGVCAHSCQLIR